jgi:hypothetical protein
MCFPGNWEFGTALSKLRNFGTPLNFSIQCFPLFETAYFLRGAGSSVGFRPLVVPMIALRGTKGYGPTCQFIHRKYLKDCPGIELVSPLLEFGYYPPGMAFWGTRIIPK